MSTKKTKTYIKEPLHLRAGVRIGTQPDLFGGPEVPIWQPTREGVAVRQARLDLPLHMSRAAKACGIDKDSLRGIEEGRFAISIDDQRRMIRAMGLEHERMLTEMA